MGALDLSILFSSVIFLHGWTGLDWIGLDAEMCAFEGVGLLCVMNEGMR